MHCNIVYMQLNLMKDWDNKLPRYQHKYEVYPHTTGNQKNPASEDFLSKNFVLLKWIRLDV